MRLFFIVKAIEIVVALLLVYLVLRTTKLCGPGGKLFPEQCPLLFDDVAQQNDERAVARFFETLYPEAANASTFTEERSGVVKRSTDEVVAQILNATAKGGSATIAENVTLENSGGIIEYVVLKIQHVYGECLTCCDIGLHNLMCIPNGFSPSLTCRSLSPVLIPVLLWLFTIPYNVAHTVKIFSNPLPPGKSVDIARSLVNGALWIFSASLLSYVHCSWSASWTPLPYSPYFPARWIIAEVVCWLTVVSALLQLCFHDKLFFTVRLTEPPRTCNDLHESTDADSPLMQSSRVFLFDSAESVEGNGAHGREV